MKKRFNMFIAVAFSAIVSLSVLSCDSAEFCEEGEGELIFSAVEYTEKRNEDYLLTDIYDTKEFNVYKRK